jgi:hypothetical protein
MDMSIGCVTHKLTHKHTLVNREPLGDRTNTRNTAHLLQSCGGWGWRTCNDRDGVGLEVELLSQRSHAPKKLGSALESQV